ncbi:hypothetical protein GCM10010129_13690 [Streptomyces fumigatiscleroticus]|nr:hypothetical protein GCM10010129_13690 [Streptomyces fumigatiscleroticus]
MGPLKVTLCAGAVLAAALTPAAYAADTGGITVSPAAPAPGTEVTLRVSGCAGRTATAVSPAFVADARLSASGSALTGVSRVRSTLPAGAYDVRVACGGAHRTGTLTVAGRRHPVAGPSAPASPVAPVDAGGGGTAHLAAAHSGDPARARGTGPGTAHTVTGLVLAGVAVVAVALGGARRGRGTGGTG